MKSVRFGLACLLVFLMASCTMKQSLPLTGKWKNVDTGQIVEFSKDGIMKCTVDGKTHQVGYRFLAPDKVEFSSGPVILGSAELRVDRETLTLVDAAGKNHRYEKIR